jgi:hypothetical protein
MISSDDITPILPSGGEKLPDNITKHFFDCMIYYLVSEVSMPTINMNCLPYLDITIAIFMIIFYTELNDQSL